MKHITQLISNILVPLLALTLTILLIPRMFLFFIPFVIGAVIAFIANPMIRFLNTKTKLLERQHASVFIIILLLMLIGGLLYICIHLIIHVCADFLEGLPEMVHTFTAYLQSLIEAHPDLLERLLGKVGEGAAESGSTEQQFGGYAAFFCDQIFCTACQCLHQRRTKHTESSGICCGHDFFILLLL